MKLKFWRTRPQSTPRALHCGPTEAVAATRRTEGCVCNGECKNVGYCPYTYNGGHGTDGVGWPD